MLDQIIVEGGIPLKGAVEVSGAKNSTLPILSSCLLFDSKISIKNVPALGDICSIIHLLINHGAKIWVGNEYLHSYEDSISFAKELKKKIAHSKEISVDCSNITELTAPYEIVRKMRASIWVLGPLLARFGKANVSLPGGCAIGVRQVDMHLEFLSKAGAEIDVSNGYINAKALKLRGVHFSFDKISVGATITAIITSSFIEEETVLSNCAQEPEIKLLCDFLISSGVKINGAGSSKIHIYGCKNLSRNSSFIILPDRIEAISYILACAITRGEITLSNVFFEDIENIIDVLNAIGIKIISTKNGLNIKSSNNYKPHNISTMPYPGYPTDAQAQYMALMCIADGTSVITENIFENRFMHVPELMRMGANITLKGNNAIVSGIPEFSAANVMATDLRASMSLIMAALSAKGTSIISRVYHLDRGYENLESKMQSLGANIYRITK